MTTPTNPDAPLRAPGGTMPVGEGLDTDPIPEPDPPAPAPDPPADPGAAGA